MAEKPAVFQAAALWWITAPPVPEKTFGGLFYCKRGIFSKKGGKPEYLQGEFLRIRSHVLTLFLPPFEPLPVSENPGIRPVLDLCRQGDSVIPEGI